MKIKFIENFRKKIGRVIYNFNLIEEGDNILIPVSGGNDSMVLLDVLGNRKRCLPYKINLYAIHIQWDSLEYSVNLDKIKKICTEYDVEFKIIKIEEEFINKYPNKSNCFYCSWTRRKLIFKTADELNCNKIAMGHHLEDSAETLLLNMIYHSSISAIPEKLSMFNGKLFLIRPLIYSYEKDIDKYAKIMDLNAEIKKCKYANENIRKSLRNILNEISKINKNGLKNMLNSHTKIFYEYLPGKKI